jgi:hypothetical protein
MVVNSAICGKTLGNMCVLAALIVATLATDTGAQGVSVAPSRIVLDGKTRAATVFLSNRSEEAETYRISLAYFTMSEDGVLLREDSLATMAPEYAGSVLRYSPRRVVIPAGGTQTVRLLVRRPRDRVVDGREFRAHLSVCSVPTVPRLKEVEEQQPELEADDQFTVRPVASVETLVPVIVRFGLPEATLTISDAAIDPTGPVQFRLNRSGERSLYGNLTVIHRDPMGNETQLYFGRGVAVYTPNPSRLFTIASPDPGLDLSRGRVVVDYQETADGGGDLHARVEIDPLQLSRR